MPKSFVVEVNPEVIRWARQTAGIDLETAKKKIKGYQELEEGKRYPTFAELEKLSRLFQRPISALLLSYVPDEYVSLKIARLKACQRMAREIMQDLGLPTEPRITPEFLPKDKPFRYYKEWIEKQNIIVLPLIGKELILEEYPVFIIANTTHKLLSLYFSFIGKKDFSPKGYRNSMGRGINGLLFDILEEGYKRGIITMQDFRECTSNWARGL